MNKQWILQLASDIEVKYGKEKRDHIFGDIGSLTNEPECLSTWFRNFTTGLDELNDKKYLHKMMASRCPCGGDYEKDGKEIRAFYDNSETLEDFVGLLRERYPYPTGGDLMELRGNVLYMTKPPGGHTDTGSYGKGCHCWLALHTDKAVSDIFCYCCTIGHTGRPFQVAFDDDIKMEFVESIICGGNACIMTVHLPEKAINM